MKNHFVCLLSLALLPLLSPLQAQPTSAPATGAVSIDPLWDGEKLWLLTPESLEAQWRGQGLRWNSPEHKDSAVLRRGSEKSGGAKLQAFGSQNVEEVAFSLKNGQLAEVSIVAWNKGDSGSVTEQEFTAIVDAWTSALNRQVAPSYEDRGKDTASAARAERRMWVGKNLLAQLEFSGGKERLRDPGSSRERLGKNFQGEFVRLRLLPKPKSMIGQNASSGGSATVRRADLTKTLVHEPSGDVFIPNLPMVDQGEKGYCAVATAARVLNYYGVPADQHDMAQVAGSRAGGGGTSTAEMEEAMKKISGKYKTRFNSLFASIDSSRELQSYLRKYNSAAKKLGKTELGLEGSSLEKMDAKVLRVVNGEGAAFDRFMRAVRANIDKGVPLMWSLQLGLFPENGEPARQAGGGHMRLIIGYNLAKNEVIFSDSWGAGHEKKRMAAPDAAAATKGLYSLQPAT